MVCVSGSNIVSDGLVFHFDMENGQKSWKGKPTTNLIPFSSSATNHKTKKSYPYNGSYKGILRTGISNDNPRTYWYNGSVGVSSSTTYTLSCLYWSSDGVLDDVYLRFSDAGWPEGTNYIQPFSSQSVTRNGSFSVTDIGNNWKYCVGTFDTLATTTTLTECFFDVDVAGREVFITDIHFEQNSFATPFVNGTRSNTEALIDIGEGSNTITPSSITYSSDGEFNFASGNYISASTGITGSEYTVLVWHYNSASSFQIVGHRTFVSSSNFRFQWDDDNSSTTGRGPFVDFSSGVGGGQAMFGTSLTPSNFASGTYNMVGMVSDGSTVKTILNNVTTGQSTIISGSRPFSSNGNIQIGNDGLSGIGGVDNINRDLGIIKIPKVLIYNRALTDAEIKQNFEATRSRYGI
jgi:hypothetical protein